MVQCYQAKQETIIWSAGKLRLVGRYAEGVRALLQVQDLKCPVAMSRKLLKTIPWYRQSYLGQQAGSQGTAGMRLLCKVHGKDGHWVYRHCKITEGL